ncbi:trypsin-like peptidase domain-containing protein [Caulobacter sp. Root1472]|uniref:trypsin-like peptidase domain-containing protein n=1 Tax=Caulobacter sp. Root1472 TaxID=1736470 RepID=UPI0007005989|nr:trypsin-like peptidase domain-containing protein [Caulobacter sp. Root1472]KQZ31387.1 serine protease [Caulobacter sp. Root1472]
MAARKSGFFVGAVAGAGVACAALVGVGMRMGPAGAAEPAQVIRTSGAPMAAGAPMFAPPPGAPMSFADIFEQVSPAVVQIDVTSKAAAAPKLRIPGLEGFDIVPKGQKGEDGEEAPGPKQQSSGSGFFISADGYLVTNNHVVADADDDGINVVLKDGRELKATIVGRDEGTDLAVLKVVDPKAKGAAFPFVNFENQAKPRVGDWVITIGNPFGLGGTATAGIISAYNRDLGDSSSNFVDYIQIDAPINRGNSGGPSFDIYGRVIGVNTAIFSPTGGSVGIGFAIPADVAEATAKQLINGGKVVRGYIGAQIQPFTKEMADAQGLGDVKGAIVADLVPGGPAQKGGLLPEDVITAVNGVEIKSGTELTREVAKGRPGDTLKLSVLRGGKPRTIEIKSGVRPTEKELSLNDDDSDEGGADAPAKPQVQKSEALGMTLVPIDESARRTYSIDPAVRGVLIDGVKANSDAGEKGLRKGDVLTSVNGEPVASAAQVSSAVEAAKKLQRPSVNLRIIRAGRPTIVPLKIAP